MCGCPNCERRICSNITDISVVVVVYCTESSSEQREDLRVQEGKVQIVVSTVLDKGRVLAERIWRMWLRRLRQSPGVTLVLTPRHPLLVIHSREFRSFVTSWNIFEC